MTTHLTLSRGNLRMQYFNNSLWINSQETARMHESHQVDAQIMKSKIHSIEKEAYSAVLRAFTAQSDVLSWGKEWLITELRMELNVTDHEHRKLLAKIDSNESVRMIRNWRRGIFHAGESLSSKSNCHGSIPSSGGNASRSITRTPYAAFSKSQKYISRGQLSSAACPSSFPDAEKTGQLPMYSTRSAGQSIEVAIHDISAPSVSKSRGTGKLRLRLHGADVGKFKRGSGKIVICATNKLMNEVERMVYGKDSHEPQLIEKAKLMLREQEIAILEALKELSGVWDEKNCSS